MRVTIDKPITDRSINQKIDRITGILDAQHKLDNLQCDWNLEIATSILQLEDDKNKEILAIQQQITKVFAIYGGVLAIVAILLSIAIYIK